MHYTCHRYFMVIDKVRDSIRFKQGLLKQSYVLLVRDHANYLQKPAIQT
jgi:hypothetical protein